MSICNIYWKMKYIYSQTYLCNHTSTRLFEICFHFAGPGNFLLDTEFLLDLYFLCKIVLKPSNVILLLLYPRSLKGEGVQCSIPVRPSVCPSVLPSALPSFCPSKMFFVAFFSVTVDGRNLIFGHKLHIGIPYCG